jgi:hypothetical protein
MTARHHVLDNLATRIERASIMVPEVFDHLDEERAQISNLAAQDYTATHHSGSAIANPTLNTAQQLDGVNQERNEIDDCIATLEVCVKMLEKATRHASRYRVSHDHIELDSERDLLEQCIECEQIRVVRTARNGLTIDDGRCLDCGRTEDLVQYERAAQKLMQRINSGR